MGYLIENESFLIAMRDRWNDLQKVASPALEETWVSMSDVFNQHLVGNAKNWDVLQLPTGTGKTQGLVRKKIWCSYCNSIY
jgi:hypothetical protein